MDRLSGLRSAGADIRYALRRLRQLAGVHTRRRGDSRHRHWREHGRVQCRPRGAAEAAPLRAPGTTRERQLSVTRSEALPDTVPSPVSPPGRPRIEVLRIRLVYSVGTTTSVTKDGEPVRLPAAFISSNFFVTLGAQPIERGRVFGPVDDESGAPAVIVSRRFADQRLAGNGDPLGHAIRLNGTSYSIVGIIANSFRFPDSVTPDIYLPIDLRVGSPVVMSINVLGRLKSTWSVDQASRDPTHSATGPQEPIHPRCSQSWQPIRRRASSACNVESLATCVACCGSRLAPLAVSY